MTDSAFKNAVAYLNGNKKLKFPDDTKLKFYAYFKQAEVGPCNTSKPSLLDFVGRTKWNAWNDLGKMASEDAQSKYVELLTSIAPEWHTEPVPSHSGPTPQQRANEDEDDDDDDKIFLDSDDEEVKGAGDTGSMFTGVSRPMQTEAEVNHELNRKKDIFFWVQKGSLDRVKEQLAGIASVNDSDEDQRTPLHFAVDRSNPEMTAFLLEQKANANCQDCDGSTPLHYAVIVEEVDLVRLLLRHKADPNIQDNDGQSAADMNENDEITALITGA